MTVVYLDSYLLINFILNFLLLLACGKLAGEPRVKWRMALGALIGAGYGALTFFPAFGFTLHPAYKVGIALVMLLIAFGKTRRLLRISAIFLGLSCAFCGGILAIEFLKGASYMKDGVVYSALDVKGLLISAAFCYGILALFFPRAGLHHVREQELRPITLRLGARKVDLTALLDSGNTLLDPVSGRQVLVAEGARLKELFPPGWQVDKRAMEAPILAIERLTHTAGPSVFRLLPYRAVGVDCGMLLALRVDLMEMGGETYRGQLVALSPTPLSDGGGYSALVGSQQGRACPERMGA